MKAYCFRVWINCGGILRFLAEIAYHQQALSLICTDVCKNMRIVGTEQFKCAISDQRIPFSEGQYIPVEVQD